MNYEYKPYEERTPDEQYKDLLKKIIKYGVNNYSQMNDGKTGATLYTRELLAETIRFNVLENGAPIITERDISGFYDKAIGEIFAFVNGARTQKELEKFGVTWWKYWLTEEKAKKRDLELDDLGPGSYGAAFHDYPKADGGTFNQFEEIIKQMKEYPHLKTHKITNWIPEFTIRNKDNQQKVVVCPCHGELHFTIHSDTLHMEMLQRSCDTVIGLPSNWAQYTALFLAMAHVLGLKPGQFIHHIENAHIYSNSMHVAEELISRDAAPFPTLEVVRHHDSIFDYRREDFVLKDYHPKAKIKKIPIGV